MKDYDINKKKKQKAEKNLGIRNVFKKFWETERPIKKIEKTMRCLNKNMAYMK